MAQIKISVINQSTVVGDSEVRVALAALQKQVHRDFYPARGVDAYLKLVGEISGW
jgi:hypothetical protein